MLVAVRTAEGDDEFRWCCLTFELSGNQRRDARPGLAKMYRVPPGRDWWLAAGAPFERGVRPLRPQSMGAAFHAQPEFACSGDIARTDGLGGLPTLP